MEKVQINESKGHSKKNTQKERVPGTIYPTAMKWAWVRLARHLDSGLHLKMKTTAFPNSELEILQVSCLWFMPQSLFHTAS